MNRKRLPTDKTVVLEYSAQLADILSRTTRLKGSIATRILSESSFNNGDINITQTTPFEITGILSVIVLSSFDNFIIEINDTVTLPCQGLFIHTGPINKVKVYPPVGLDQLRMQYLWS